MYKLIKSVYTVILNCLGISFISVIPLFYNSGYSLIEIYQGWGLSFIIAYAASQVFALLAHGCVNSEFHDNVAKAFYGLPYVEHIMRYFTFYLYMICSMLGLSLFAIMLADTINALCKFYEAALPTVYINICTYILLLLIIYFINIFCTSHSKNIMYTGLAYMKIAITIFIPIISLANNTNMASISNLFSYDMVYNFWHALKNMFIFRNTNSIKVAFGTVLAMSGAESLMMVIDRDVKSSTANRAMFLGLLICVGIYIFNTAVCFYYVDLNICATQSVSPYVLMLPTSQLISNIIVNILIALMLAGSIYGWFDVLQSTCQNSAHLMPQLFNVASDKIQTLVISLSIFFMLCIIESLKNVPNFLYSLLAIINYITIMVYLVGFVALIAKFTLPLRRN